MFFTPTKIVTVSRFYQRNKLSTTNYTLRVRSIGKSGFRFSKSGFRISNRTRNPKTDFNAEISVYGFSFLSFDWEIRKRI